MQVLDYRYCNIRMTILTRKGVIAIGFATRLRQVMKARQLTQVELARRLHRRQAEISRWVNGAWPNEQALIDLADGLGVSLDYLVAGRGPAAGITPGLDADAAVRVSRQATRPTAAARRRRTGNGP